MSRKRAEAATRATVKVTTTPNRTPQQSNVLTPDQLQWAAVGPIDPPYSLTRLCELVFEEGSALRPNIDAYSTNVEGFGHTIEPTIDLDAPDARSKVHEALVLERIHDGEVPMVTPAEVDATMLLVRSAMAIEKMFVESWLEDCTEEMSFIELRERTRADLEATGTAYWEASRRDDGQLAAFTHLPSVCTRIMQVDDCAHETYPLRRVSALGYRRRARRKRFRRFVQMANGMEAVYFKEFGDDRIMSAKNGRYYASVEDLNGHPPATEVIHFSIYSPLSIYGLPRWTSAMPAVQGTRNAEVMNVVFFKNNCIPPVMLLVEGGSMGGEAALQKLEDILEDKLKGVKNFNKIMLVEAAATADSLGVNMPVVPKIRVEKLTDAQQKDALFQEYEKNNAEKVGQQFRLPRLLRGEMTDFNRSTAESALLYAEQQVFGPLRQKFDWFFNKVVFADLNIRFWQFKSKAPDVRDPATLMEMLERAAKSQILMPNEGREIAKDIFNREFPKVEEPWANQPIANLMRGTSATGEVANAIVQMRAALETQERASFGSDVQAARTSAAVEDEETELTIEVPPDQFRALFAPSKPKAS